MKSYIRLGAGAAGLVALACLLGSCSGTDSGQLVDPPTVRIATVGNTPTSAAGATLVTTTVRSGADVQLSGEDSDGGNISINGFSWQQTDGAGVPSVALLYRNASTVSFTAPSVAQNTTLNFKLTVTNASGQTSSQAAQVLVVPGSDTNRFLTLQTVPPTIPAPPRHFRAAVSTVAGLFNLTADLPVCVQLARTVIYTPRSGAAESGSVVLPVQQVDAKWLSTVGGVAGFVSAANGAFSNPTVAFDVPTLNSEDIFAAYNAPTASINNQLVPSDVDSAYLRMAVTATPGSCDGTLPGGALASSQLMLQLFDEAGSPIGAPATAVADGAPVTIDSNLTDLTLTADGTAGLTPDDFLRAQTSLPGSPTPTQFETRESTTAYYQAVDPTSSKTTLTAWLSANCFDPNNANYGVGESNYSVVHAQYTNNFDLGFGRDMYFSTCSNGNMASVVVNYPSLSAALSKLGAFLAVAMEYTPAAGSSAPCFTNPADAGTNTGACFAKFYAFAPDERTGVFKRVLSVNFDRRGQKYVPGACTVCHGGTPNFTPGLAYPAAGNVDAVFMPWDQGSLLFSDTDPAFPCAVYTASPACQSINSSLFTQVAQAPNLQRLNALAWRTYQHSEIVAPVNIDRYQSLRGLLTKWYGGDPAATTAHAFDDSVTPTAWLQSGQSASSDGDLYHRVFAHSCRACHTDLNGGALIGGLQMQSLQSFDLFTKPLAPGQPALLQQIVYQLAQMPLARLTTDRFWVPSGSNPSAAQTLANYINSLPGATPVPVDSEQHVIAPGAPVIGVLNGAVPLSASAPNPFTGVQGLMLDAASRSYFISGYQWMLCPTGGTGAPGTCPNSLGLIGTPVTPAGSSVPAEAGAAYPAFPVAAGSYDLTLTAGASVIGATPPASVNYQLVVQ